MKRITDCRIGKGCIIQENVDLYKCEIGDNTKIKSFTYIEEGVIIGKNCKIEPFVFIPAGVTIENCVFVGPGVVFTNDRHPRAVNAKNELKSEWALEKTLVKEGASVGANSTVVCGVTIGKFSMVGAGSVVTKDVPDYSLAYGNPAKIVGEVFDSHERK